MLCTGDQSYHWFLTFFHSIHFSCGQSFSHLHTHLYIIDQNLYGLPTRPREFPFSGAVLIRSILWPVRHVRCFGHPWHSLVLRFDGYFSTVRLGSIQTYLCDGHTYKFYPITLSPTVTFIRRGRLSVALGLRIGHNLVTSGTILPALVTPRSIYLYTAGTHPACHSNILRSIYLFTAGTHPACHSNILRKHVRRHSFMLGLPNKIVSIDRFDSYRDNPSTWP